MSCPCGHEHRMHFMYFSPNPESPIGGFCRHKEDIQGPINSTSHSYDSDSDDCISYSTPTYTYGTYTSYSTTYSGQNQYSVPSVCHTTNVSWNAHKVSSGFKGSYASETTTWGKIGEKTCSCNSCRCNYCISDQAQKDYWDGYRKKYERERMERERNRKEQERKEKMEKERLQRIQEENKRWRNAQFTERRKMRGLFRAVLRSLKEVFVCTTNR
uniref:Uncharacterized protein n=1 Tax=Clandestinovirus TaxID=2831644 RepID=A0A8F8PMD6_9VIRU|nr:hypothetical protein KOM_12_171 [Clandestinovirus]